MPTPRISTLPHEPGIYLIVNTINEHQYVGSAVDIRARWGLHIAKLAKGTHHNPKLQNAWRKYGADAFVCHVLELAPVESLASREQYWLDTLNAAGRSDMYNICPVAYSHRGAKRSAESRARISAAQRIVNATPERKKAAGQRLRQYNESLRGKPQSDVHRQRISTALTGKKPTPETIEKLRLAHTGVPKPTLRGRPLSTEHRAAIGRASAGKTGALHPRSRTIEQLTLDGQLIGRFVGIAEAARQTGVLRTAINNCLHGRSKSAGGFKWRCVIADDERSLPC